VHWCMVARRSASVLKGLRTMLLAAFPHENRGNAAQIAWRGGVAGVTHVERGDAGHARCTYGVITYAVQHSCLLFDLFPPLLARACP
jgi:hypothetical protein